MLIPTNCSTGVLARQQSLRNFFLILAVTKTGAVDRKVDDLHFDAFGHQVLRSVNRSDCLTVFAFIVKRFRVAPLRLGHIG
jgi:hypothetical protein